MAVPPKAAVIRGRHAPQHLTKSCCNMADSQLLLKVCYEKAFQNSKLVDIGKISHMGKGSVDLDYADTC